MHFLIFLFCAMTYIALFIIGLLCPRGKSDWKIDAKTTVYIVIGIFIVVIIGLFLYFAGRYISWPSIGLITVYICTFAFIILILAGLFLPKGFQSKQSG